MIAPIALYADPINTSLWGTFIVIMAGVSFVTARFAVARKARGATFVRASFYALTALLLYVALSMFTRIITHKPMIELTEKTLRVDYPGALTIVIPWYDVVGIRTVFSGKRMVMRELAAIETIQQFFDVQPYLARIIFFYSNAFWHDNAPSICIYHDLLPIGASELCDILKKYRARLPENR